MGSISRSSSYSRQEMAIIWKMVLSLPMPDTATRARSPTSDIHSRNAEMAISRPMMIAAASVNTTGCSSSSGGFCTSRTSAVATMSLSATGSRKAPKLLCSSMRRAM